MSEVVIRINKRIVERSLYWIVIIALAVALFVQQSPAPEVSSEELVAAQEQVTTLQTQVDTLTQTLAEKEAQIIDLETAEPEVVEEETPPLTGMIAAEEPEVVELSGRLEFDWNVRMDGDSLDYVAFTVYNGKERTEEVSYSLQWDDSLFENVQNTGRLSVRSDQTVSETISDYTSNPPSDVDTLKLTFRDSDGEILEVLEQRVR